MINAWVIHAMWNGVRSSWSPLRSRNTNSIKSAKTHQTKLHWESNRIKVCVCVRCWLTIISSVIKPQVNASESPSRLFLIFFFHSCMTIYYQKNRKIPFEPVLLWFSSSNLCLNKFDSFVEIIVKGQLCHMWNIHMFCSSFFGTPDIFFKLCSCSSVIFSVVDPLVYSNCWYC